MNIFISGGCKNGKSYYAQQLAKNMQVAARAKGQDKPLYYIATMEAVDEEDDQRILRHQKDRAGWGFQTIEQGRDIASIRADFSGTFLLDSVTALLSNEMFKKDGTIDGDAYKKISEDLTGFAKKTGNTVFVSDYIYSDAIEYDPITESYRRGLAAIDRQLAKACDVVIEVVYGHIHVLKGELD